MKKRLKLVSIVVFIGISLCNLSAQSGINGIKISGAKGEDINKTYDWLFEAIDAITLTDQSGADITMELTKDFDFVDDVGSDADGNLAILTEGNWNHLTIFNPEKKYTITPYNRNGCFILDGVSNVTIDGLIIDEQRDLSGITVGSYFVFRRNCKNVKFTNCELIGATTQAVIRFQNGVHEDIVIEKSRIGGESTIDAANGAIYAAPDSYVKSIEIKGNHIVNSIMPVNSSSGEVCYSIHDAARKTTYSSPDDKGWNIVDNDLYGESSISVGTNVSYGGEKGGIYLEMNNPVAHTITDNFFGRKDAVLQERQFPFAKYTTVKLGTTTSASDPEAKLTKALKIERNTLRDLQVMAQNPELRFVESYVNNILIADNAMEHVRLMGNKNSTNSPTNSILYCAYDINYAADLVFENNKIHNNRVGDFFTVNVTQYYVKVDNVPDGQNNYQINDNAFSQNTLNAINTDKATMRNTFFHGIYIAGENAKGKISGNTIMGPNTRISINPNQGGGQYPVYEQIYITTSGCDVLDNFLLDHPDSYVGGSSTNQSSYRDCKLTGVRVTGGCITMQDNILRFGRNDTRCLDKVTFFDIYKCWTAIEYNTTYVYSNSDGTSGGSATGTSSLFVFGAGIFKDLTPCCQNKFSFNEVYYNNTTNSAIGVFLFEFKDKPRPDNEILDQYFTDNCLHTTGNLIGTADSTNYEPSGGQYMPQAPVRPPYNSDGNSIYDYTSKETCGSYADNRYVKGYVSLYVRDTNVEIPKIEDPNDPNSIPDYRYNTLGECFYSGIKKYGGDSNTNYESIYQLLEEKEDAFKDKYVTVRVLRAIKDDIIINEDGSETIEQYGEKFPAVLQLPPNKDGSVNKTGNWKSFVIEAVHGEAVITISEKAYISKPDENDPYYNGPYYFNDVKEDESGYNPGHSLMTIAVDNVQIKGDLQTTTGIPNFVLEGGAYYDYDNGGVLEKRPIEIRRLLTLDNVKDVSITFAGFRGSPELKNRPLDCIHADGDNITISDCYLGNLFQFGHQSYYIHSDNSNNLNINNSHFYEKKALYGTSESNDVFSAIHLEKANGAMITNNWLGGNSSYVGDGLGMFVKEGGSDRFSVIDVYGEDANSVNTIAGNRITNIRWLNDEGGDLFCIKGKTGHFIIKDNIIGSKDISIIPEPEPDIAGRGTRNIEEQSRANSIDDIIANLGSSIVFKNGISAIGIVVTEGTMECMDNRLNQVYNYHANGAVNYYAYGIYLDSQENESAMDNLGKRRNSSISQNFVFGHNIYSQGNHTLKMAGISAKFNEKSADNGIINITRNWIPGSEAFETIGEDTDFNSQVSFVSANNLNNKGDINIWSNVIYAQSKEGVELSNLTVMAFEVIAKGRVSLFNNTAVFRNIEFDNSCMVHAYVANQSTMRIANNMLINNDKFGEIYHFFLERGSTGPTPKKFQN